MKFFTVKKLYRKVRYSPDRPTSWNIYNSEFPYYLGSCPIGHYALEKTLRVLIHKGVLTAYYNITKEGVTFIVDKEKIFIPKFKGYDRRTGKRV